MLRQRQLDYHPIRFSIVNYSSNALTQLVGGNFGATLVNSKIHAEFFSNFFLLSHKFADNFVTADNHRPERKLAPRFYDFFLQANDDFLTQLFAVEENHLYIKNF